VSGFDERFRSAGEDWDFSQRVLAVGRGVFHLPALVAESHERASVEGLARKTVRNAGCDLRNTEPELRCSALRRMRPLNATPSMLRLLLERMARDVLKRRWHLLPVDLVIGGRSLLLVWTASRAAGR
jgi:hypothetical protein